MWWVMQWVWRREVGGGFGCRGLGGGYVVGHMVEVMDCVGHVAADYGGYGLCGLCGRSYGSCCGVG